MIRSNVFNLAALLGLGAVVAGEITLHRRVILFEGTVAMLIAAVCLAVVLGGPGPEVGLLASVAVLVPYPIVSGISAQRLGTLGLPQAWVRWLSGQRVDPALQAACLSRHQLGVAERVGEQRDPLVGGHQGDREVAGVAPTHEPELALGPLNREG